MVKLPLKSKLTQISIEKTETVSPSPLVNNVPIESKTPSFLNPIKISPEQSLLNQILKMRNLRAEDKISTEEALETLYAAADTLAKKSKEKIHRPFQKKWEDMPFGKYKTHALGDVPPDYLQWAVDNIDDMDNKWPGLSDSIKNILHGI